MVPPGSNGLFKKGPYVIFGRGHCGGRILSEAYYRNGIYMGALSRKRRDTQVMGLKEHEGMVMIVKGAYQYPDAPPARQQELERILTEHVESLRRGARGKPFGWKRPFTRTES